MAQTKQILNSLEILGFIRQNGSQCRIATLTLKTEPRMNKTGNTLGQVFKIAKHQVLINADYVEAVKRLIAEKLDVDKSAVEYEAGKSAYIHPFDDSPALVVKASAPDDGVFYLQCRPMKNLGYEYVNEGGEILDKEQVKKFLPARKPGPEWKPAIMAPKLSSIVRLAVSGVVLSTDDLAEAEAILAND